MAALLQEAGTSRRERERERKEKGALRSVISHRATQRVSDCRLPAILPLTSLASVVRCSSKTLPAVNLISCTEHTTTVRPLRSIPLPTSAPIHPFNPSTLSLKPATMPSTASRLRWTFPSTAVYSVIPLLLLLLTGCAGASDAANAAPIPASRVDVLLNAAYRSPPILPNFISFSTETYWVRCWIGNTTPRPAWINLVRQLQCTPQSQHPITFRIGGNSGDTSFYNPHHTLPVPDLPGPAWQYNITDVDLSVLRVAMQQTRSELIIGLNMRQSHNFSLATDYVTALAQHTGLELIYAFEVGNEPDFYGGNRIKPSTWSIEDYVDEVRQYAAAIAAVLPNATDIYYQAGAVATDAWTAQLASIVANTSTVPYVSASAHFYPTTSCNHNRVTPLQLLSDDYAQREAHFIAHQRLVDQVGALGVPVVIGEGNTASCFGAPNVSNSYASALWTIDTLFNIADVGVAGWSFTVGGLYHDDSAYHVPVNDSAWQFRDCSDDNRVVVQPMYYAFRLFNLATASYSALLHARVTATDPLIKVWPVHSSVTGTISVVVLHKNANATAATTVSVSLGVRQSMYARTATISRMHSSGGLTAQFGIRLAGQTYDGSVDGQPVGTRTDEEVQREVDGAFVFKVEPLEVVLLQVETVARQAEHSQRAERSVWE